MKKTHSISMFRSWMRSGMIPILYNRKTLCCDCKSKRPKQLKNLMKCLHSKTLTLLNPNNNMHIPPYLFHNQKLPKLVIISFILKTTRPSCVIQGLHCREKLEANHPNGLQGWGVEKGSSTYTNSLIYL